MLELFEAIEYQLRHFDYKEVFLYSIQKKTKVHTCNCGIGILVRKTENKSFVDNTKNLLKAFAISVPHEKAMAIRDDVALFQTTKTRLVKISDRNEGGKSDEEIETAIKLKLFRKPSQPKSNWMYLMPQVWKKTENIEILDERFLKN